MKITLNGEMHTPTAPADAPLTLERLLTDCGFTGTLATALNEAFVPADARAETPVQDGDRVEVLAPMQGG